MRVRLVFVASLALVLGTVWPAGAQEQTAAIEGVVKDATGSLLAGASVQARHEAGGVVSTVSRGNGNYRLPALAPGRYEITASLAGFAPTKVENVVLTLGRVASVNISLKVGKTEEIQVTGEAPLIDITQSARSTNLRAEAITKLPRGRDFSSIVTQAPGTNNESRLGGISIDGASAGENVFIIDGAETTNLQSGTQGKELITDFVDEVQVKSSGYAAEYRGSTGGVINVITKSGSNQWRGDVGLYFSGSALEAGRRPSLRRNLTNVSVAEYVTYPEDDIARLEPGFSLGGPIKKDKVWFFAGYQPQLITTERTASFIDKQVRTKKETVNTHYMTGNLTAQLSDKVRARVSYTGSSQKDDGVLQSLEGTGNPDVPYDIVDKYPNHSASFNVDFIATSTLNFGVRGGYFTQDHSQDGGYSGVRYQFSGTNIGLPGVTPELARPNGFETYPFFFSTTMDKQKRLQFQLDGTSYLTGGGKHELKFGVQLDRIGNEVESGEPGNRVVLRWNQSLGGRRGTYGYYQVRSNGLVPKRGFLTVGEISVSNIGLFLQDSWAITDRFTLNVGLRTERESIPSFADPALGLPDVAIKFKFGDKVAPRVGFAWDVKGDGKWKAYGSWGIFYDITKLEMPRGSFGGDKWLEYYYALDTLNWPTLMDAPGCPPACPGLLLRGPIDFRHPSNEPGAGFIDPDLKPMKLQEAALGVEREISSNMSFSVRYVHKQIDRAIEDVGSLDEQGNEIYTLGNPGFGITSQTGFGPGFPKAKRDYDAVELDLIRRFVGNWSARVNYTWSRLYGNYSGLSQSDENGRTSPNVGRVFDYPVMVFDEKAQPVLGVLATDRTHQFKAQFVRDLGFRTTAGLKVFAASGLPVSREAAFVTGSGYPVQYQGRNSDGRTTFFSQFDLYVEHEIKLGGNKRLSLSLNILNLFNQDIATNRFRNELAPGQQINVSAEEFFKGVNTQALIAAQKLQRDSRFLMDSEFQAPFRARLAAKFSF